MIILQIIFVIQYVVLRTLPSKEKGFLGRAFDDMKEMASILSKDFKFVRVDLYEVNGEIKFGEMTFTPTTHSFTDSFQLELGGYIQL